MNYGFISEFRFQISDFRFQILAILTGFPAISFAAGATKAFTCIRINTAALLLEFTTFFEEHLYGDAGYCKPNEYNGKDEYFKSCGHDDLLLYKEQQR